MTRHALRRSLAAALLAAPAAFAASGASAAPQVLALFSTDRPVALACEGEVCRAELPTLCLQPGRRVPQPGRGYRLAEGQSLTLTGRGAGENQVSVALDREVFVTAARTHVSVEVSVPRAIVDRYGLEDARIAIGETAAAVPVAAADDLRRQTAGEIAWATGEARRLATRDRRPRTGPDAGGAADDPDVERAAGRGPRCAVGVDG